MITIYVQIVLHRWITMWRSIYTLAEKRRVFPKAFVGINLSKGRLREVAHKGRGESKIPKILRMC